MARGSIMSQPKNLNAASKPRPTARHRGTCTQHCGSRRWRVARGFLRSRGVLRPSDEFTNEGKPIGTLISKTATSCPDTWRFFELGDGHAAPDRRGPRVRARARGGAAGRGRGPARRKTYHSERAGGAARAVPEARGEAATGARLSFLRATRGVGV